LSQSPEFPLLFTHGFLCCLLDEQTFVKVHHQVLFFVEVWALLPPVLQQLVFLLVCNSLHSLYTKPASTTLVSLATADAIIEPAKLKMLFLSVFSELPAPRLPPTCNRRLSSELPITPSTFQLLQQGSNYCNKFLFTQSGDCGTEIAALFGKNPKCCDFHYPYHNHRMHCLSEKNTAIRWNF
jgi:hypothetical protein